jgi:hypothetical protein
MLTAIRRELPLPAAALLTGLTDAMAEPAPLTKTDRTAETIQPMPQRLAPSATAPANDYARCVEVLDALLAQFGPDPLAELASDSVTLARVF